MDVRGTIIYGALDNLVDQANHRRFAGHVPELFNIMITYVIGIISIARRPLAGLRIKRLQCLLNVGLYRNAGLNLNLACHLDCFDSK